MGRLRQTEPDFPRPILVLTDILIVSQSIEFDLFDDRAEARDTANESKVVITPAKSNDLTRLEDSHFSSIFY